MIGTDTDDKPQCSQQTLVSDSIYTQFTALPTSPICHLFTMGTYGRLMLFLPLLFAPVANSVSSLQVNLTSGKFIGTTTTADGIDKWLGVPFAQPPVGSLRFKAPVPITRPHTGIRNATQFGNACPQVPSANLGAPMAEDCLVLNVNIVLLYS